MNKHVCNVTQAYFDYHDYKGKKCSYSKYYQRLTRGGFSFNESISSKSLHLKTKTVFDGRICTSCGQFKFWLFFHRSKSGFNGFTSSCIECRNKAKKLYRSNPGVRERENEYKRLKRSINPDRTNLDNIYYSDPLIKNNRKIIGKVSRLEALKSKVYYFANKGFDIDKLRSIYNFKFNI